MKKLQKLKGLGSEKGFFIVFVALAIFALIGMVGLAIDVGYAYMVKGQLQNAADAGALAGAGTIYPVSSSSTPTTFPSPDFDVAQVSADTFVRKNIAAGANLTNTDIERIEAGYWNLDQDPAGIQPSTIVPAGKCSGSGSVCTSNAGCTATEVCLIKDVPAVLVTVKKPVPLFFAKVFGVQTFTPSATAVAATGFPQSGKPFPIAVTKCMVEHYFSQPTLPNPPEEIKIWGAYSHVPGCNTGQWTSLSSISNSASDIRNLIYSAEPSEELNIGENIHIATGNMNVLYNDIQRDFVGKVVQLPVVLDATLATNTSTPITGFVDFYINSVIGTGSNTQITGNFLAFHIDPNTSTPGGPIGNTVTPPVLLK